MTTTRACCWRFGTMPDERVSAGAIGAATVSITDDDDPFVTVMYDQSSYTVAEGGTQTVTVTLSADPERTIIIPIEKADQGGADVRRLLGRTLQCHLQRGGDVQALHHQRDPGHGG